tara:strand:- start:28 stop:450 length:423 start_codon:yes stop_codon:yes gene_type:complete
MKSGKYLVGGLIRGAGGRALKAFMKSDIYKELKGDMVKKINKLYSKRESPRLIGKATVKQRDKFLQGLKKLDMKQQKAVIIEKAMDAGKIIGQNKKIPRNMQAALLRGKRNILKYQKKIEREGKAYLLKGERMIKGKRDN